MCSSDLGSDSEDIKLPIFADNIFIGGASQSTNEMEKRHNHFTGIAKEREGYNPSPILYTKAIEKYGKYWNYFSEQELNKLFGVEDTDTIDEKFIKRWGDPENRRKYKELSDKPLSEEEKRKIMEDIKKAREDVDTLAQVILKEVWNL